LGRKLYSKKLIDLKIKLPALQAHLYLAFPFFFAHNKDEIRLWR